MITQVKYMLMAVVEVISLIFGIVVFGSLCLWLGVLYRLWMMHRTKPTIREGLSLPNPIESSVSIVVPAHNEERVIDKCATALRKQSHKNIQIIFVLDRCTDNTLEILQRHADEDVRVCIIENQHCPDDWAGKCNAAKLGSEKATGEWLIFTDADTQFDEELVRCAVASAIKREASLLSILSTLTISKAFERVAQPIASTFLVRQYPVDRVNRKRNPRPFANGQFLLFSREIYEQIGGHDAVKDDLLEDIAFANYIGHRNLGRVQLLFADGLLKCSMYPTYEAFKTGWNRIYIEASARNVSRLMRSALLAIIVGVILPAVSIAGIFIGIEWSTLLMWLSVSSLIACILTICWLYKINNAPMFFAVFAPIGSVIVAKLFIESALMLKSRTPICWGGREYILEPKQ
jgi:chlorobactene glucosyltransferase